VRPARHARRAGWRQAVADHTLDFEPFDGDATQFSELLFDADHHLDAANGAVTAADFDRSQFE